MKHVEVYAHYLRPWVQENVLNLVYFRIDDLVVDIFTNSIKEARFVKTWATLGIQEDAIMGGV